MSIPKMRKAWAALPPRAVKLRTRVTTSGLRHKMVCMRSHSDGGVDVVSARNCELFEVLKVIGEKEVQVVEKCLCPVPPCSIPAKKIIQVIVNTISNDTAFTDKVVKEGLFHVEIIFVSADDVVRHESCDVHFLVAVDIPGTRPGLHVQNTLLRLEQDTAIVTRSPQEGVTCQVFNIRIVAHFLVKVKESVQRELVVCRRPEQCFQFSNCIPTSIFRC